MYHTSQRAAALASPVGAVMALIQVVAVGCGWLGTAEGATADE